MPHRDFLSTPERASVDVRRAIRDHHAMVYRVAFGVVGNAVDAEDIVQSTFLTLVRRRSSIRDDAALPAWLARVAVNEARQWIRGETRRRGRELTVAKARREGIGSNEERAMSRDEVREAVDQLPEDLRTPLLLHYVEGLQYREIAEVLQCSEGAIAKRLHAGRQKLERRLAPLGALAPLPRLLGEVAPKVPVGLEERVVLAVEGAAVAAGTFAVGSSSKFVWSAISAVALVALTTLWTVQPDPVTYAGPAGSDDAPVMVAAAENDASDEGSELAGLTDEMIDELTKGMLRRPAREAGFARIFGRVIDADGAPLAAVPVTLELVRDSVVSRRVERTDGDGRYDFGEIDVAGGATGSVVGSGADETSTDVGATDWARHKPPFLGQTMSFSGTRATVRVSRDGYRSVEDGAYHLSGGTEIERTHTMNVAARIAGRVLDGNGEPVPGAEVWVRGGTGSGDSNFSALLAGDRRTVSDEAGRFVLPRVGEARYLLEATAPGFGSTVQLAEANGEEVTLALAPSGRLKVLVEHRGEKRPIVNARVALFRGGRSFQQGVTGSDGVVWFEADPGEYELAVFRNDFPVAVEPVTLIADEVIERRVRADDGIALTIQMSETPRQVGWHLQATLRPEWPSGAAPARVGVRPSSYSLAWGPHQAARYVDRSGSMRFEGLVPGRYVFEVGGVEKGRRSYDLVTEVIEIGPAPRETTRRIEFTEVERGRLSVTARGPEGEPEGFPLIRAERVDTIGAVVAQLGRDGHGVLSVMPGDYRVSVSRPGMAPKELGVIDVRLGETRALEVTFDRVVDAESVFDFDRRLWLAGDVPYAGLLLLLEDLAVVPTAVAPDFDPAGRRVTWPSDVGTADFLQQHIRYLGLSWEMRSGQLVWVGR
ncbi:MAG: sigma-70 family RNA polymerase sigma factor [Planctomycetota bacterium]